MGSEVFNAEQRGYMAYLASLPPNQVCGCGWYRAGNCPNCPPDDLDDINSVSCGACFDRGGWDEDGEWIICYHGDEPPAE